MFREMPRLMPPARGGLARLAGAAACMIAFGFVMEGCATMALYTVGRAADSSDDHHMRLAPRPVCGYGMIRRGERIALELQDGRRVTGHFSDLECGADTSIVLAPYAGTSWDVPFPDGKAQRIPLSTVRAVSVPGHRYRTAALIVGIPTDIYLVTLFIMWASSFDLQ